MKTARAHHLPVTFLRSMDSTVPTWTWRDKLLALALTTHEDGLHHCGHPKSLTLSPDSEGYFVTGTVVCQACAALDRRAARHRGEDAPHGEQVVTWNSATPGERIRPWSGDVNPDS